MGGFRYCLINNEQEMKKLATYGQIKHILKLNEECKNKDYLASMLKMLNKDTVFELNWQQANRTINQINKWNKACRKRKNRKQKRKKKARRQKRESYDKWIKEHTKYLQSSHWRSIKNRYKKDFCFVCNNTDNLHLHHRNYKCLHKETEKDLVTLCSICHRKVHELAKSKKNKLNINTAVEYLAKSSIFHT